MMKNCFKDWSQSRGTVAPLIECQAQDQEIALQICYISEQTLPSLHVKMENNRPTSETALK